MNNNNTIALVTGASSGIGLQIAKCLAARKYNLLLVSNEEDKLQLVQKDLSNEFGVEVDYFCVNLAVLNAAQEVFDYCQSKNYEVEVLVNNAGFLVFGEVVETNLQKTESMILLHNLCVGQLCQLFGKQMKERGRGFILNNSSISAYKAFPYIPFYGATKAFIKYLTHALRHELKMYGVHVTCLSPGATATELYDPNVIDVKKAMKYGVMLPAAYVAKCAVDGLFKNKATVVPGFSTQAMLFFSRLTPDWVIYLIRKKFGHKLSF
jgi:uncharacterized protein